MIGCQGAIKKAYRSKSLEYHPDKCEGDKVGPEGDAQQLDEMVEGSCSVEWTDYNSMNVRGAEAE